MWSDFERLVESYPRHVVVGAVAIGIVCVLMTGWRERARRHGVITELFRMVGHAVLGGLVVAVFIHFAVEKSFLREISRQVIAGSALRSLLPQNLAELVEHHVIRDAFVYESFAHDLRIAAPNPTRPLTADLCLDYRSSIEIVVKNVSSDVGVFRWWFGATDASSPCSGGTALERLRVRGSPNGPMSPVNLSAAQRLDNEPITRKAGDVARISGASRSDVRWMHDIEIGSGESVTVQYDFVGQVRANDHAVQFFLHPTEEAKLTVDLPAGLDGAGHAWHPASHSLEWCETETDVRAARQFVHVKKGSLPLNAVEVRWWPENTTDDAR